MFDEESPEPYSDTAIIASDPRNDELSAFQRLVLCLMALQGSFDENSDEQLEAFLDGTLAIEVVVDMPRGTDDAPRIKKADGLSANHRRILDIILSAHPEARIKDDQPNPDAIGDIMFLPPPPLPSGHEQIELTAYAEQMLMGFLKERGLSAAEAAALLHS